MVQMAAVLTVAFSVDLPPGTGDVQHDHVQKAEVRCRLLLCRRPRTLHLIDRS